MDTAALDGAIQTLRDNADSWANRPLERKIAHVEQLIAGVAAVAAEQVATAGRAKGAEVEQHRGEEWLHGPLLVIRNLRLLQRALREVERHGCPQLPRRALRTRPDGQLIARIFPHELTDHLLYGGFSAEVWMQHGVTEETLPATQASFYRQAAPAGRVSLVLGAGNGPSIGPLDAVYKLFVEGQVVLLKMNPVNEYLAPFIEQAFAPLVRAGVFRVVCGGADVGAYLCQHEAIDEVHITGSDVTHDVIVFGPGAEGQRRKRDNRPLLDKRITSELGNVSPVIVVPGSWSAAELRFQAENVATQMTDNAGFNCNAAKMLITHRDWPQREAFLGELRSVLRSVPPRKAYYPGAAARWDNFVGHYPQAERYGAGGGGRLPWAFIPGVDSSQTDQLCFSEESFCGVTGETTLAGADAADFLARATTFANEVLWGTLSAEIIIDPRTAKKNAVALEDAIAALRYGTVAVNHWPAICYGLGSPPWGAFPGHTLDDIQSGIGVVHNTFMFDRSEKTVIRGPFRMRPKPPWFVTNRVTHRLAPKLVRFEVDPQLTRVPALLVTALQG
jgi:acyl-CoA reductase-like NAD-dependent aldehyde dehydrogenase